MTQFIRTILLGAVIIGTLATATPASAATVVVTIGHHHRHHHHGTGIIGIITAIGAADRSGMGSR